MRSNNVSAAIIGYLNRKNIKYFEVEGLNKQLLEFTRDLYKREPLPVFEQNYYHIISYLHYNSKIIGARFRFGSSILVVREDGVFFFTPNPDDFRNLIEEFSCLITELDLQQVTLLNVSKDWKERWKEDILQFKAEIIPRSREEVVYDVERLTALSGKSFAELRNTRNKLLSSESLGFVDVTDKNICAAISVLDRWQTFQGGRYIKKKGDKEKYVVEKLAECAKTDKNIKVQLATFEGVAQSLIIYFPIPNRPGWGEIYMVKGLNRRSEGGLHGISDASYLKIFSVFKENRIKWVNDGELGSELGTREHKLHFQPINFLQSFDITINL